MKQKVAAIIFAIYKNSNEPQKSFRHLTTCRAAVAGGLLSAAEHQKLLSPYCSSAVSLQTLITQHSALYH